MAFGPAVGLELVDTLSSEPSLKGYHLAAVRGDLLAKLGRVNEARGELRGRPALEMPASAPCSWGMPARRGTGQAAKDKRSWRYR